MCAVWSGGVHWADTLQAEDLSRRFFDAVDKYHLRRRFNHLARVV